MKNTFLNLRDELEKARFTETKRSLYWRFLLSLPISDLETFYFVINKDSRIDILSAFRDQHPMWLVDSLAEPELSFKPPFLNWEENKYRIARTVFKMLDGTEYSLASTFMRLAEVVTDRTLNFEKVVADKEAQELYNRAYTLLGWTYVFESPGWVGDLLWKGSFLVNGLRFGFDIEGAVRKFLNELKTVQVRHETIIELQGLLKDNKTPLTSVESNAKGRTVGEWIALCEKESQTSNQTAGSPGQAVTRFLASHQLETKTLDDTDKYVLESLLQLYTKLATGSFEVPLVERDFPERLYEFLQNPKNKQFWSSLEAVQQDFINWYKEQPSDEIARQKLIQSFLDRLPIERFSNELSTINDWLEMLTPTQHAKDLIMYHESDGQFHWNDELLK
jgi:hypothetical protein